MIFLFRIASHMMIEVVVIDSQKTGRKPISRRDSDKAGNDFPITVKINTYIFSSVVF